MDGPLHQNSVACVNNKYKPLAFFLSFSDIVGGFSIEPRIDPRRSAMILLNGTLPTRPESCFGSFFKRS